jgi:hypothetical protein
MKVRVAFREEGTFWNAYMALPDTMENARLIGSISMGAVRQSPEIKDAFMDVMKRVLALAIEGATGEVPDHWITEKAPESERSGHG